MTKATTSSATKAPEGDAEGEKKVDDTAAIPSEQQLAETASKPKNDGQAQKVERPWREWSELEINEALMSGNTEALSLDIEEIEAAARANQDVNLAKLLDFTVTGIVEHATGMRGLVMTDKTHGEQVMLFFAQNPIEPKAGFPVIVGR